MPSTNYRQQKVGKNFENAVAKAEMTRTALADLVGVHQSSFSYWYKRGVTTRYANAVAEVLDLDVKTILNKAQMGRRKTKPLAPTTTKIAFELSPQRTVNLELLGLIANMRLSVQQEDTLQSLALTFLGEES